MPADDVDDPVPAHDQLLELMRPGALIAKLERSFPKSSLRGVQIALVHGASVCHAAYAGDGPAPFENAANPTGCLTKLLTTTLARIAIAEGHFALDSEIAPILGTARVGGLSSITARHLLEHTHGLDDSGVARAPVRDDGFIDVPRLHAELLRSRRLAEPGLLYSYSNAGAWLMAAVLERVYAARYEAVLRSRLFNPIAAEVRFHGRPLPGFARNEICPAIGNELAISIEDVTRLLRAFLPEERRGVLCTDWSAANESTTPLPGWHSMELGIHLGWKHYGAGWFGHNSEHVDAAALLRVHPQWRIGVFIAAASPSPVAIGATLLRETLPFNARRPKLLRAGELAALDPERYVGRYANGAAEVEVLADAAAALQLRAFAKQDGSVATNPFYTASLHAAQWDTFFPLPAEPTSFPFVQFLEPKAQQLRYLWNGKTLWPRTS